MRYEKVGGVDCSYFDAGLCRSCTLLPVPMSTRVKSQQAQVADLLAPFWVTGEKEQIWLPPVVGPESGFRIKVKMVVAGTTEHPTLGILDDDGMGIDLTDCPLYPESPHRDSHTPLAHQARAGPAVQRAQT